ncbi:hypothetical protein BDR26DRAFT_940923 [Obelidium mucronatum]|nr:hypothetical protein BDR26DRAFT_940923 [Obelidium mucronatum]
MLKFQHTALVSAAAAFSTVLAIVFNGMQEADFHEFQKHHCEPAYEGATMHNAADFHEFQKHHCEPAYEGATMHNARSRLP